MNRTFLFPFAAMAAIGLTAFSTTAGTIEIQLSGVNIEYDGSTISSIDDSLSTFSDTLVTVNFLEDGALVDSLTSDISLAVVIPGVTGIDVGGDTVLSGSGGVFNIDFGPEGSLALDLSEVSITYVDVPGIIQFAFGGSAASIASQALPSGLILGDPVSVSFSTQIDDGTLTDDGDLVAPVITGFTASGTGEVRGVAVPEPVAISLVLLAGAGLLAQRRRIVA